jgi:hypothetical protein
MLGQINRIGSLLIFAVVLASGIGIPEGRSQVVGAPLLHQPIDLSGKWKLDTGEIISITQDDLGRVSATYTPKKKCWDKEQTELLYGVVRARPNGEILIEPKDKYGFTACTRTERMWRECPTVAKIFKTDFKASISPYGSISGQVLRPGYYLPEGDFRRCTPDADYEDWEEFSLTRCRPGSQDDPCR